MARAAAAGASKEAVVALPSAPEKAKNVENDIPQEWEATLLPGNEKVGVQLKPSREYSLWGEDSEDELLTFNDRVDEVIPPMEFDDVVVPPPLSTAAPPPPAHTENNSSSSTPSRKRRAND
jgi:hypothetical protein